jgi:HAD superfamily hydrolase (TIGR01484 family)
MNTPETVLAMPVPAVVLSDVDDTITWHGGLPVAALAAMHALHDRGVELVLVTGACAGWCDQMARTWPVSAVVGENGAFTIERRGRRLAYVDTQDEPTRSAHQARLLELASALLRRLPGWRHAGDQAYRRYDVALDHGQDVGPATPQDIDLAVQGFRDAGAKATASSIHVNAWLGDFSKLSAARRYLERHRGWSPDTMRERCAFIGDSSNDRDMFEFFPRSAGVANVAKFLYQLPTPPASIMSKPGGHGFAEFVGQLLAVSPQ